MNEKMTEYSDIFEKVILASKSLFPNAALIPAQKINTEPIQERLDMRMSSKKEAISETNRVMAFR
ncbi:hypothetical protein AALB16_08755 [Lachnospiraceae bacterium 62-35]